MIEREVKTNALVEPLGLETSLDRTSAGRLEIGVRNDVAEYMTNSITRITKLRLV